MMSFLTKFFGKKSEPASGEALAQFEELVRKAEQAFPESVKVAMRLIEKRSSAIDSIADFGGPVHEAFVNLVLKAIHLKHQHAGAPSILRTAAELPSLLVLTDEGVGSLEGLLARAGTDASELVYVRYVKEWSQWNNVLLPIETHLLFAADPRTMLVFPSPDDFMARRAWLLGTAHGMDHAMDIRRVPDALAHLARRQAGVTEDQDYLSDFGYPMSRFLSR